MPPLPHSSPGGATTEWTVIAPADEAYYSFIDPVTMKGWVGLVGWPTADGLPIKWLPISCRSGTDQWKFATKVKVTRPINRTPKRFGKICTPESILQGRHHHILKVGFNIFCLYPPVTFWGVYISRKRFRKQESQVRPRAPVVRPLSKIYEFV